MTMALKHLRSSRGRASFTLCLTPKRPGPKGDSFYALLMGWRTPHVWPISRLTLGKVFNGHSWSHQRQWADREEQMAPRHCQARTGEQLQDLWEADTRPWVRAEASEEAMSVFRVWDGGGRGKGLKSQGRNKAWELVIRDDQLMKSQEHVLSLLSLVSPFVHLLVNFYSSLTGSLTWFLSWVSLPHSYPSVFLWLLILRLGFNLDVASPESIYWSAAPY